ncbi:membrane protein [Mycobacterium tuberculosis]|nr:membrane protein [Mycobacterium tuberculosis]
MVAAIAAVVAVAALIVALTNARPAATPATTSVPTYTAAQRQLCDTYKLVAHAVPVDTNGSDKALARITLTNAAAILDNAAADPALDAKHRDAARASDRLPHNDRNGEWWHSS